MMDKSKKKMMSESQDIRDLMHHGNYSMAMDLRGMPMRECVCGCNVFLALISFDDDNDIAFYFLDGECVNCGSLVTLPTPLDKEL